MNEVSVKCFGVDALVLSFPREMEKNTYLKTCHDYNRT